MREKYIDENLKEISEEFGAFIKQKRKEKGLTLVELAKKSELSHSYLSQLENGKRNLPPMSTQIKICRALGVSVLELPTTEEHYYSYDELERFSNEVDYEDIAKDIKVLSKDADNFRNEVLEDPSFRRALQNYVNEVGYTDYTVTPSGLLGVYE
ncbi:helix-turn-helix domain-containing protein [Paenibacillus dendritiformis]|uniref:helix-turn-helix domain-containing protein n=1 Tax=Paenibacillus dendritiformis TaxID=130049 RepID=UPI0018CE9091|nr:helix-turn-helix transcriptional regulator [Paenibacillus dendritiformis]